MALRLAEAKAKAIKNDEALIIGADQIAVVNNAILGKPRNHENARQQLLAVNQQTVTFLTGLCVVNSKTGMMQKDCLAYRVYFRKLMENEIERYLLQEKPYDCTGSFKSEGYGITLVKRMEGDDPNTLVGLPLIRLTEMLRQEGLSIP